MNAVVPAAHSKIVGGSTAARVLNCPGSVRLVQAAPPQPSSVYADRGTLLHNAIAIVLGRGVDPSDLIGMKYESEVLTEELIDEKLRPALAALDELDPEQEMLFAVESRVHFGEYLPGVFGSADLLGKLPAKRRAVVLDFKFGDGVAVSAEENAQGLFYGAAALRTPETSWVFDDVDTVLIVIVQPPEVKTWETTVRRLREFEFELARAVKASEAPDAKLKMGYWCRFCPAKPSCPLFTGLVDRALSASLHNVDKIALAGWLGQIERLEEWIAALREQALQILENGGTVPGWKLVAKRSTRQWADKAQAAAALLAAGATEADIYTEPELKSVAQTEKALKARKIALPTEHVVSLSSGHTMVPEHDPRPAIVQIGQQLTAALSKIV